MPPGRTHRVLVVDDHADSIELLGLLLRHFGFEVEAAHTVARALEIAERQPIDAVVSDLGLPDGTGYDLIRALRRYGPVPAIAISGLLEPDDLQETRRAGFDQHLTKPIDVEQLVAELQRLLGTMAAPV